MKKRKEHKGEVFQAIALLSQIALSMMVSMAMSIYIGYWLDRLCGTNFIIIIMTIVGIGASIRSLFILTKRFTKEDK